MTKRTGPDHPVWEQAARARARRFTPGDPAATRDAVLMVVDTPNPPLRLFLGEAPLGIAAADHESQLATWRQWRLVALLSRATAGKGASLLRPPGQAGRGVRLRYGLATGSRRSARTADYDLHAR
jgi:hypothetical protein